MNDINFDELDKAVNSALQSKPTEDSAPPAPQEPVVAAPAVRPASALPTKRRGQFMDMVHPSSDMTQSTKDAEEKPASPIHRQSPIITPLNPSIVETTVTPGDTKDVKGHDGHESDNHDEAKASEKDTSESDDAVVPGDVSTPDHVWPDPIDVPSVQSESSRDIETEAHDQSPASLKSSEVAAVESGFSDDKKPESEPDATAPGAALDVASDAVQTSPFIEGTEVEKRPLGAFAGAEDPKAGMPDSVIPAELPVELNPDIVSVESDDPSRIVEEDDAKKTDNVSSVDTGPAQSIPQQYHVSETSDDEEHSVFDTKQYHQPLTPPVKQRSGGKVFKYLLTGILLLALGAAGGYLVWTLKLF